MAAVSMATAESGFPGPVPIGCLWYMRSDCGLLLTVSVLYAGMQSDTIMKMWEGLRAGSQTKLGWNPAPDSVNSWSLYCLTCDMRTKIASWKMVMTAGWLLVCTLLSTASGSSSSAFPLGKDWIDPSDWQPGTEVGKKQDWQVRRGVW